MQALSPVFQTDPKAAYLAHRQEIDAAISRVLESGWYVLGSEVEAFEFEFARFVGVSDAIGVASGTDGIELILRALGIGRGDLVITVSHTAVATVAGIELAESTPILVDVDPETFNLDTATLQLTIETILAKPALGRLKAIMPVHLYGRPVDMATIMQIADRYNLYVVEDCSQAHGAVTSNKQVGSWGHAAAYSLYPTKNLGAIGDAGIVVTSESALAEEMRSMRQYGWKERYISAVPGMNSRLDPLQAAILRVKLQYLATENQRRAEIAATYRQNLSHTNFIHPTEPKDGVHVYHQYVLRTPQRDELRKFLSDRGIGTLIHYPAPVHLQPAYRDRLPISIQGLANTERIMSEIVSLPMHPYLNNLEVEQVCDTISDWVTQL